MFTGSFPHKRFDLGRYVLFEQLTLNQRVPGSSPGAPTKRPLSPSHFLHKAKALDVRVKPCPCGVRKPLEAQKTAPALMPLGDQLLGGSPGGVTGRMLPELEPALACGKFAGKNLVGIDIDQ